MGLPPSMQGSLKSPQSTNWDDLGIGARETRGWVKHSQTLKGCTGLPLNDLNGSERVQPIKVNDRSQDLAYKWMGYCTISNTPSPCRFLSHQCTAKSQPRKSPSRMSGLPMSQRWPRRRGGCSGCTLGCLVIVHYTSCVQRGASDFT